MNPLKPPKFFSTLLDKTKKALDPLFKLFERFFFFFSLRLRYILRATFFTPLLELYSIFFLRLCFTAKVSTMNTLFYIISVLPFIFL